MKNYRRPRPHRRGQALVEFALILPIMLMIIMGGLGLGLVIAQRMQLIHAAQEAAVSGAQNGGCTGALGRVPQVLGREPDAKGCEERGQMVEVTLSDSSHLVLPFVPESITVTERAVMREPEPSPTP